MLTVLDEYTREALCVAVKPKMNNEDVLDALYPLLLKCAKPEYIRSDNGSEFIAATLQDLLRRVGIYRPANRVEMANTLVSSRNFKILSDLWEDMGFIEPVATSFNIKDDFEGTMISEWGRARRYRATSSLLRFAQRFGITSENVNEHFKKDFARRRLVNISYESKPIFGQRFNTRSKEGAGKLFRKIESDVREIDDFLAKTTTNLNDTPQLCRTFNRGDHPKFDLDMGGRFYCTSDDNWQNKSEEERSNITINECPTVEVDVRASQLSVLYGLCKEVPKDRTDPYDIPGIEREVVKKIVVAAIGNGVMPKRWPRGFAVEYTELFGRKLQKMHKLKDVVSAIVKRHPVLKRLSAGELDWARIQFEESEILRQCMLELIRNYETASLPVHDSLVVSLQKISKLIGHKSMVMSQKYTHLEGTDVVEEVRELMKGDT